MFRTKARSLTAVAAAALALSTAVPATAQSAGSVAAGPCRATSASTGSEVELVLTGSYVADDAASNVVLTCHVVMGGVRIVSTTDPLVGHVAVLASEHRIDTRPFYVCYELHVRRILDIWNSDYSTNC